MVFLLEKCVAMCDLVHGVATIFHFRYLVAISANPISHTKIMPGKMQITVARATLIFQTIFHIMFAVTRNIDNAQSPYRALDHI